MSEVAPSIMSEADKREQEFEDEGSDFDSDDCVLPSDDGETIEEEQDEDGKTPEVFTESDTESDVLRKQHSLEQEYVKFQHVDVLSDFGSNEPFLVDGDALILYALDNAWLDWHNGGQFLHHVYIVESFLQKLCERGCQFDIFFMQGNEDLFRREGSYLLARTVIMLHLSSKSTQCPKVHLISGSWLDFREGETSSFSELLHDFRPSFVLTNSGHCVEDHQIAFAVAQMHFAHKCLVFHRVVISLDGLTFKGSRIFGFLFRPPQLREKMKMTKTYSTFPRILTKSGNVRPHSAHVRQNSDFRNSVYLPSLCRVLEESPDDRTRGCAMVSIACVLLIQRLSLAERAFILPNPGQCALSTMTGLAKTVSEFEEKLFTALTDSVQQAVDTGITLDRTITDIFDGRLFTLVLLQLAAGWTMPDWLGADCVKQFTSPSINCADVVLKIEQRDVAMFAQSENWWSAAERLLSLNQEERVYAQSLLEEAERLRSTKTPLQRAHLKGVGDVDMLVEVLGDVQEKMKQFEVESPQGETPSLGPFSPHHYHRYAVG